MKKENSLYPVIALVVALGGFLLRFDGVVNDDVKERESRKSFLTTTVQDLKYTCVK